MKISEIIKKVNKTKEFEANVYLLDFALNNFDMLLNMNHKLN